MSMVTAMPVFGSASVMVCASRSSAHSLSAGLGVARHEVGELHEEEGEVALRPSARRQSRIIAGKSVRYW